MCADLLDEGPMTHPIITEALSCFKSRAGFRGILRMPQSATYIVIVREIVDKDAWALLDISSSKEDPN